MLRALNMNCYLQALKKYAVFEGRATREEFWAFYLLNFIFCIVFLTYSSFSMVRIFGIIFLLATLLPALAVQVRRLHDIGYSGWLTLLWLFPILGGIVLLTFCIRDSKPGDQYGANPKGIPEGEKPVNWYLEVFKKYADFEGRATREEFWTFCLPNFVFCIVFLAYSPFYIIKILGIIFLLVTLVPALAVQVRRLHDIGYSGWLALLWFFPIVGGFLILLPLCASDSQPGANQYGENPKEIPEPKTAQDEE